MSTQQTIVAASSLAFTCPIGGEHEIEPQVETDIVVAITAHLANELGRDIPVAMRIKIFWARAEALRQDAPHKQIEQQFMALAKQSGLFTDLGRHGGEDVRHVLSWALRGRVPFASNQEKNNDHQTFP